VSELLQGVDVARLAAGFGRLLHDAGLPVTPSRSARFALALRMVSPTTTDELYWTARVALVSDRLELPLFDRLFRHVFAGIFDPAESRGDPNAPPPASAGGDQHRESRRSKRPPVDGVGPEPKGASAEARDTVSEDTGVSENPMPAMMSAEERLRGKDFAVWSPEELHRLRHMMDHVVVHPALRRTHRLRRHPRGARVDLRATLRASRRTNGDPYRLICRRSRVRPRRVVLLADVSGSMEKYALAYLTFLHGAVRAVQAEAFVFATRLTRLTRELQLHDPVAALAQARLATPDWSGGTRIGETLAAFIDGWGRRGLARGAVVVIVSDGWAGDDPGVVGREMERLARLAYRIVWVNPRKQNPNYEPLVGGMAAALPFVDVFVSGHSVTALREVAAAIAAPRVPLSV
jgi:uncharacterized protein